MTTTSEDDLRAMIDAVAIESATRYRLHGEPRDVPAPPSVDAAPADVPLVQQLQTALYTAIYCRRTGRRGPTGDLADRELVHALSAANRGRGTWEPGWIIAGLEEDGRLPVRKDGLTLWVHRGQLRSRGLDAHGQGPGGRPGSRCRVRVGKELRELMPGFYVAIGDGDERDERDDDERLVRLYWHVRREGAAALIGAVTGALNPLRIPFRAKVVNFGEGYPRSDAGVLYLDRSVYARAAAVLPRIHDEVRAHLDADVPCFTRPLAPGLGLAEDPGGDESFGQHRCRLVTEALWRGFVDGVDADARLGRVTAAFAQAGFDVARLHLRPGSHDDYGSLGGAVDIAAAASTRPQRRARSKTELRARRKQERQWRRSNQRS